jgi:D-alanine-D-alanine ligase
MTDTPFAFSAAERVLAEDERIFTSMDQRPITGDRISVLNAEVDGPVIDEL